MPFRVSRRAKYARLIFPFAPIGEVKIFVLNFHEMDSSECEQPNVWFGGIVVVVRAKWSDECVYCGIYSK